ncbi:portal protein [Nevskia soli]|uniref:portal protein n=1 Tax=Nevskia soli TaxID=418856 RepID=UPI0015D8A7F3|nr:portal protein [Nevskia soli]
MRDRYVYAMAQDFEDRADAESDVMFAAGGEGQWTPAVLAARKLAKRPILTEDRLTPSIAQVVNDGRQNKPSIQVTPKDEGTKETADYFQGRIRQIEYECDSDIAYDTAREGQVSCGRGFYRLTTRYIRGHKGPMELVIEAIENQFSVLFDPSARKYDRSDAEYCFVLRLMTRDEHKRAFGEDTTANMRSFYSDDSNNPAPEWMGVGGDMAQILVADYYVKTYDDDGECTVTIYVTDGVENHDETEWIGTQIPVFPQWGRTIIKEGKKRTYSLIRGAKDPQKLVNLYVSNIAEQIAQMPKTPYIGAEGQFLNREDEWEGVNDDPRAYIQYKIVKDSGGNSIGPPVRVVNEPPIQALVTGYLQAIDAVKAAMGIFNDALGAQSNADSGIAIDSRKKESDVTNFHFSDNEARTRKALGRALLELIPIVDGTAPGERTTRSEDGKTKTVKINAPFMDEKTGKMVIHAMGKGDYECAISTGPSYTSQRDQAFQIYANIAQKDKNFMSVAGDLLFKAMDAPFADQIAERYQKMLPPALQDDKNENGQKQAQQAQQQLQAMSQQHAAMVDQLHKMAQIIETEKQANDTKLQIAAMNAWVQIRVAGIKAGNAVDIADADREGARLEAMFDRSHEAALAAVGASQDVAAQQADQQHQQQMQASGQDAAAAQQQSAQDASAAQAQQAQQQQATQP